MNPTSYVIDLGLDSNLAIESGSAYPLQQGLVAVNDTNTGTGVPQWFTKFHKQDAISFRLWDITGESSGNLKIVSFAAYFLSPTDTTRLSSPLAPDSPNPIVYSEKIFPVPSTSVKSSVFLSPHSGWVLGSDTHPLGAAFELGNQGRYLLRIETVIVVPPMGRRTYVLDPEMIVGSSEGGEIDPTKIKKPTS